MELVRHKLDVSLSETYEKRTKEHECSGTLRLREYRVLRRMIRTEHKHFVFLFFPSYNRISDIFLNTA